MYGWEFPPYISGGLGIACHDLTKALSEIGTKITFVLPTLQGKTDTNLHLELLSSSDHVIEETQQKTLSYEEFKERMDIIGIESTLRPYFTEKSYQEFIERLINKGAILEDHQNFYKLSLTGQYGPDLISEVFNQSSNSTFFQFGLRYWLIKNRAQIDTTYMNSFNRFGEDQSFSVGLRLLSLPFLP